MKTWALITLAVLVSTLFSTVLAAAGVAYLR